METVDFSESSRSKARLKYRAGQEGSQGVNTDLKGSKEEMHHTKQGRIPTFCLGPIYYLVLFLALTHSFYFT